MLIEKLLILVLSIYLVLCAGSCYMYPIYLNKIIDRFNFNIREINFFGTCINMGMWMGFPMGFIYDSYGPKISCSFSVLFVCGSYLALHYIMNYVTEISIYPLLIIAFILGQGCSLLYSISLTTNLKNFRFKESSAIVGLLISNLAIAPSIFTTFRENLKLLTMNNFFLILSIFMGAIIIICGLVFRNLPAEESYQTGNTQGDKLVRTYEKFKERKVVRVLNYFNFLTLVVYISGVLYNYRMQKYIFPLILIYPAMVLLNFLSLIVERVGCFDKLYKREFIKKMNLEGGADMSIELRFMKDINTIALNQEYNTESVNNSMKLNEKDESVKIETLDVTFLDAVKSRNFIIIFFMLLLGIGSVISNLNNVHYVLQTINNYEKLTANGGSGRFHLEDEATIVIYRRRELFIYVIVYFIFNSTTRLFSGLFLDSLIKSGGKKNIHSHILFFSFIGFFSQFIGVFAALYKSLLFVSVALAGSTHGGFMTFVPVFTRTEYGLKNMGKILGFITTASAIGALIISDFLFILPYDYFGDKCQGPICFYPSYMITSVLFLVNVLLAYFGILAPIKAAAKSMNNSQNIIKLDK